MKQSVDGCNGGAETELRQNVFLCCHIPYLSYLFAMFVELKDSVGWTC